MSNPISYTWGYSFTEYQRTNPNRPLPGDQLDAELQKVQISTQQAVAAIGDLRRSDGALQNGIVTQASFASDVYISMKQPTQWASNTAYDLTSTVFNGTSFYVAKVVHTSGVTFDVTKWTFLADFSAQSVSDSGVWFSATDTVKSGSYTIVTGDAGKMLVYNSGSAGTFTFDVTGNLGTGLFLVRNVGAGTLTVRAASGQSIEGVANPTGLSLPTNWFGLVWVSGSTLRATLIPSYQTRMTGPATSVAGNFAAFADTGGLAIVDSGLSASSLGVFSSLPEIVATGDYTLLASDKGKAHIANKATAIQFTLPAVSTITTGAYVIRNIGVGLLTVIPTGADTIEGGASFTIPQGSAGIFWSNGTTWKIMTSRRLATTTEAQAGAAVGVIMDPALVAAAITAQVAFVQGSTTIYTSSQTWNKPSDLGANELCCWEAIGASSGSGTSAGGSGGGSSGLAFFRGGELPSSLSLVVPAGPAAATTGGPATVGSGPPYMAYGGGGTYAATGGAGGGDKSLLGVGWDGRGAGAPATAANNTPGNDAYNGGGSPGTGSVSATAGGKSIRGGGAGGSNISPAAGGTSMFAGPGGGFNASGTAPGGGPGAGPGGLVGSRGEIRFTRFGYKV